METTSNESAKGSIRSLIIVFAIALSFLAWGFLIFYFVGDKGSPPWDFGIAQDVPGESAYSTQRSLPGKGSEPEAQHVSQKPREVEEGGKEEKR